MVHSYAGLGIRSVVVLSLSKIHELRYGVADTDKFGIMYLTT